MDICLEGEIKFYCFKTSRFRDCLLQQHCPAYAYWYNSHELLKETWLSKMVGGGNVREHLVFFSGWDKGHTPPGKPAVSQSLESYEGLAYKQTPSAQHIVEIQNKCLLAFNQARVCLSACALLSRSTEFPFTFPHYLLLACKWEWQKQLVLENGWEKLCWLQNALQNVKSYLSGNFLHCSANCNK